MEEIIYERTAKYYETDKMGIVHHTNYIRWFEEARCEFMSARGLPYSTMEDRGIMIPVRSVECQYKHPVKFDRAVLIKAAIEKFDGLRLNVVYEITDKETGTLCVTGRSEHCFVRASDFRPVKITKTNPEMAEIFMSRE